MIPANNILLLGLRWHEGLIRAIVHEAAERRWHINLRASLYDMSAVALAKEEVPDFQVAD